MILYHGGMSPSKLSVGAGLFAACLPGLSVAGEVSALERPELRMQIDACLLAPDTMVALRTLLRQNPAFRSIYCAKEDSAQLKVVFAPSRDAQGNRIYDQELPTDEVVVTEVSRIIHQYETNLHTVRMLYVWGMPTDYKTIGIGVR